MLAAQMGRNRKSKLRQDWDSAKVNIIREAIFAKFTQHSNIAKATLSTGEAKIMEHTEKDDYWGDGGNGRGQNMLGRILMDIREILKCPEKASKRLFN